MKRLRSIISLAMVFFILFSSIQLPYSPSGSNPGVYAAEDEASGSVTEAIYGAGGDSSPEEESINEAGAESGRDPGAVYAEEAGSASDWEIVTLDDAWLTADLVLADNEYTEQEFSAIYYYGNITKDLYLPTEGPNGSTIVWESNDETVVATDGTVNRPLYGNDEVQVELTARICMGDAESWKAFTVLVRRFGTTPEEELLLADRSWLDNLVEENNWRYEEVTADLDLPSSGPNGSDISWTTSNPELVAESGVITRPGYSQGNAGVTLTAVISRGEFLSVQLEFYITIKALDIDDDERVPLDKDWLTLERVLNGNSADDIRTKLNLPASGPNGSDINWASSDEAFITSGGIVKRPSEGQGDQPVILTATISYGDSQDIKEFTVVVSALEPGEAEVLLQADYDWLTCYILTDYETNFLDMVDEDLYLPAFGENGSSISWTSSNEAVIATDGKVTRPDYEQGNVDVVLTAHISYGSLSVDKGFWATVLALPMTDANKVKLDKEWLTSELVLAGNSADDVKLDLYLPVAGPKGSTISWTSSDEAVVTAGGKVIRPAETDGDKPITLTAAISLGEASDVKTFAFTVTVIEKAFFALKFDDFSNAEDKLQFNGVSGIADTVDRYGNSIQALEFTNQWNATTGGSVFTPGKLHLAEDMSFSTTFTYRGKYPFEPYGKDGIVFNLQSYDNTAYDNGTIRPSLSIAIETNYFGSGQGSWYHYDYISDTIKVFYNGNDDASLSNGRALTSTQVWMEDGTGYWNFIKDPATCKTVWVEYNGSSKLLEIRLSYGAERPGFGSPVFQVYNVDLGEIFTSVDSNLDIEDVQNIYAGFTGSLGKTTGTNEIWGWYFKNDSTPIDLDAYSLIDASNITLSANPPAGASSSTITASVYGDGGPAAGLQVDFSTSIGTLDSYSAVTDEAGEASVVLNSDIPGTAAVKAIAAGGAMAYTEVLIAVTDEDCVAADEAWLTGEQLLNGNIALDNVTGNLNLPLVGRSGSSISWTSDKEGVVVLAGEGAGTVSNPSPMDGDQDLILTATISKGEVSAVKTFNITVKVLDEDRASLDRNWLTDELVLNGNTALDNVTGNLNLPVTGPNGSNISWTSADSSAIALDGKITRPTFTIGDKAVTLTAVIRKGSSELEKIFNLTVKALAETDAEAVAADHAWLTGDILLNGNSGLGNVTGNLNLPVSGPRGSDISWISSNNSVAAVNGAVTRSAYIQGDKKVTLTASIAKGTGTSSKTFDIIVVKLPKTVEDSVAMDSAWLDVSRTLGNNLSQYSISGNLVLPDTGPEGSSITWTSSMSGVISSSGAVTRPTYLEGHKPVKLTAVLKLEDKQLSKEFEYTVLRIPDTEPPRIVGTSPENNSSGVGFNTREIVITFNEPIKYGKEGNINNDMHLFNPDYQFTSKRIENNKLILTLDNDMKFGANYFLGIYRGVITDIAGNSLNDHYYYSFTVETKLNSKIDVASISPGDREKGVSLNPEVSFRYSYGEISRGNAFDNISLRSRSGEAVPVTRSLSGDTVTLSLAGDAVLKPGTVYNVSIPAGAVKDRYKNESSAKTIQFLTQGDDKIPRVISTFPSEGQNDVDIHQNIIINFSEAVNRLERYIQLNDDKGGSVGAAIDRMNATNWIYIRTYEPLKPNTRYTLTLPYNYVTSPSGNPMAFDYTLTFTTGANSLGIRNVSPTSIYQGSGASLSSPLEIEFSSTAARGPEFDNIRIQDSEGDTVNFSLEETDKKVVLTPTMGLKTAESYTVHIPAGAYENESNGINDTLDYRFAAAGKLGLNGATFVPNPSARWLVNKPLTFDTQWIERSFNNSGYKINSMEWSFGDGRTGSGKSPEHAYGVAGEYNVTLRLKDHKGVTYDFEQTVTIEGYKSSDVSMSVEAYHSNGMLVSTYFQEPLYTDGTSSINDYRFYKIYLSQNGRPIPDETIKVQLYKNGSLQKDLGTVTTATVSKYTNALGKEFVVGGGAGYRFWYDGKGYLGAYELAFVYGSPEEGKVVRVPVTLVEYGDKRTLRVKLYSKDSGKYVEHPETMSFEVDGVKKYARLEWYDAIDGYCYSIKDVDSTQLHTLKLGDDGFIRYTSDTEYVWNDEMKIVLPVKGRLPGITRIKSDFFDTDESYRTAFFIAGVDMPPVTFEVEADWTGLAPGYYEISTNTNSVKWTSKEPKIELHPGYDLKIGEGLFVRMVSKSGTKSPWMGVNMEVLPKPELGLGIDLNVVYREGKYRIGGPIEFTELMGGRISLLKDVPLLDNAKSFGLGNGNHEFDGEMKASFRRAYFDIDFSGDFTYGKENEKSMKKSKAVSKVVSTGYEISTEMYGGVMLVYNRSSREWTMEYGEITLLGDGNYYWKRGYTLPKIGVGVDAKLTMGSVVGGTLIIDRTEDSEREYAGIIYFDPYVRVSIEAGVKGLNIEGYVEGRIGGEVHIPTGYVGANPSIKAGIEATAFMYSATLYEKSIMNKHWDNGKPKVQSSLMATTEQLAAELGTEGVELTPMSRGYINRESEWLAGNAAEGSGQMSIMAAAMEEVTNPHLEILKENIYPEAEVQLVRNGDELWMIWTDDNPERDPMNRTQMCYAVLKDGVWSEPVWIGQDGTADFSPAAAAAENGVLMAWQNIKETMGPDAELLSFVENAEISVTENVYKSGGGDVRIVMLTDDDKLDHSPRLAANGSNALLVWTKSEGLGFTLESGAGEDTTPANSDSLVFSRWNGSSWSAPLVIEDSLSAVLDSSLYMSGDEGLLLYTLDMDNDLSTQEDVEIFALIYDGSSWGEAQALTDNQVSDSNPKAANYNGEWFITWQQDGSIKYKIGLDGEIRTEEALNNVQGNYGIAPEDGEKPQIALIYKHITSDNVKTLSTSFYDIENDIWSNEIQLTEESGYVRYFSPAFAEEGKLNIVYTQAEIVTEVIEGEEYKNPSDKVDLNMLSYEPVHDLALSSEDGLQISPSNPLPGTRTIVTATIRNQGDFAENATLCLYDGDSEAGEKIGEASMVQPIPARSSAEVQIEWFVDAEERNKYDIYAVVHIEDDAEEIDSDNNAINHKILTADIAVNSLEFEHLANDEYLVRAAVANVGSKSLEAIKVQLDQGDIEQVVDMAEFDQLKPGQAEGLDFIVSYQDLAEDESGKVNMTLRVILPEAIEENSTDNNTYEFVLEPASIVVEKVDPAPGEIRVGTEKSLTLTFSMNVEEGERFDEIVLQDNNLNTVEANKTIEGNTLTVTPLSPMDNDTQYALSVPKDAVGDSYGHVMESDYSLSFVTTASSPEAVFAYPGSGMGNTALDTEIKMQFNQTIMRGPTYGDIKLYGPDSKPVSVEITLDGEWLQANPIGLLEENKQYSLTVPRGAVENSKGEAQQEDFTLEFTTARASDGGNDDNDDNGSEDRDEVQLPQGTIGNNQDYRVSRQSSADGRSTVTVDIGVQVISRLGSGTEPMVILDMTKDVLEDDIIRINLAGNAMNQLAISHKGLNIVTGKGNLQLPADLVKSLASAGPIAITIAQNNRSVMDNDRVSAGVYDFSINAGEKQITALGTEVTVTIPLDKSKIGSAKRIIVCVYDETTGSWNPVGGLANAEEGSVTFRTVHFSTYAAFETVRHFDDVTSSWAKDKVEVMASRRLIEGKSNKTFAPDDTITRAEFAAMVVRSLYAGYSLKKGTFDDVPAEAWYAAAVETAYENGLITGSGASRFNPNSEITREQMAAIACRLYRYKIGTKTADQVSNTFNDRQDISSYAEEAVNFVANAKIMTGSGGSFEPGRGATRQEAAVVLYRLLEFMGEL